MWAKWPLLIPTRADLRPFQRLPIPWLPGLQSVIFQRSRIDFRGYGEGSPWNWPRACATETEPI
jgi:hypothetical protein